LSANLCMKSVLIKLMTSRFVIRLCVWSISKSGVATVKDDIVGLEEDISVDIETNSVGALQSTEALDT